MHSIHRKWKLSLVLSIMTRRNTNMFWRGESSCEVREESESAKISALLEKSLQRENGEGIESIVAALIRTTWVYCIL